MDYALTRDQTLRFGYSQNNNKNRNLGIGAYDLPERAYTSDSNGYTFRALEAGPIGRRIFINSRMTMTWRDFGSQSAVEAPTIIVQDAFTSHFEAALVVDACALLIALGFQPWLVPYRPNGKPLHVHGFLARFASGRP